MRVPVSGIVVHRYNDREAEAGAMQPDQLPGKLASSRPAPDTLAPFLPEHP